MTSTQGGTNARRAAREKGTEAPASKARGGGAGRGPSRPGRSERAAETARRRKLDPDALVALEEERDFLLRSLEDLEREHDAGDVDDVDYAELKDDYTARAAAVLRAIDDRRVLAQQTRSRRSWLRLVAVLAVVAVAAGVAGVLLARTTSDRASGGQVSGAATTNSRDLINQAQTFTGQATTALGNGDAKGALKYYQDAIDTYQKVLKVQPNDTQALTYQGWVIHTISVNSDPSVQAQLDAQAKQRLDQAISIDPTYADARIFRAILERNASAWAAAQTDLDAVDRSKLPPGMVSMVDQVQADVTARNNGSTPTTAAGG